MSSIGEMSLAQWQARQIEKAAGILAHFVESTKEERLKWRPATEEASKTRSAMEQLAECIYANKRLRSQLRGEEVAAPDEADSFGSVGEATAALKASARALAEEVRQIRTEDLERTIQTHRGPMPVALAMQFPVRNMTYHMGQINMIQLLYGDTEFHIEAEFTSL